MTDAKLLRPFDQLAQYRDALRDFPCRSAVQRGVHEVVRTNGSDANVRFLMQQANAARRVGSEDRILSRIEDPFDGIEPRFTRPCKFGWPSVGRKGLQPSVDRCG